MSQEIVEAVRALAREKGIAEEKLITALEDALLSAYKKQPGAVKYARVHLDPDLGEYRVEELILPEEREMMFEEYRDRVGELITGIVQQSDSRYTLVQLRERVEALLPKSEQVDGERYDHSQRVKAVIKEVSSSTRGPGYRSKIAVVSHADGVDPVGACVGPRGSRVRMVVSELRGEKIDIIPYNNEPARFIAKALSPARVREVLVDDESETEYARAEAEAAFGGDVEGDHGDFSGRCSAVLSNGKRCPNASLPS